MPTAGELIGGFWDASPSPIIDAYVSAWTLLSGPATKTQPGSRPRAWTIRKDQAVSPGLDGRPTTGYPVPDTDFDPSWIAVSMAGGNALVADVDFEVIAGYAWFVIDPIPLATGYLTWVEGIAVHSADLWYGSPAEVAPSVANVTATAYALSQAIATACDSPASGKTTETVEAVWTAADGTSRVITDQAVYNLGAEDVPAVAVGDILAPGTAIGSAWALDKLGPNTTSDYVTTPASFHQGVTDGDITWYKAQAPLVVDTVSSRTRVRFRLGASSGDFLAFWAESHTRGIEPGERSLAQALDTRTNPGDDPGPESLPTSISPQAFLCQELLAGNAYRLILQPDRFGPNASTMAEVTAAARVAAGSYATVFIWDTEEPALTPVDPA